MLDIKFIRENPEIVRKGAENKGVSVNIDEIIGLDKEFRELSTEIQNLRAQRNTFNEQIKGKPTEEQIEKGKKIRNALDEKEKELKKIEDKLKKLILRIPNPPKEDVKTGKDESENEIVKKWGEPRKFDFSPKDHVDLGKTLDIIDIERAAKISGARFYYLKKQGALLEFALIQYVLETLIKEGFELIIPPVLIKKEIMEKLGYTEEGQDEDIFYLEKDNLYLVGTSEQSVVPIYKDETLNGKDLPKRFVSFSTCFRREAGSYGKDTKGILRVHQFDKVEMVSFVKRGEDDKEHDFLLSLEEKLIQGLGLSYQLVKMCTGDLGFPAARKYDIEVWIPTQNKYRELTSTSTTTDFQARGLGIKYKEDEKIEFTNILNGTAFAIGRTLIAILENYQRKDGSVEVPKVLQKYTGFSEIKPRE